METFPARLPAFPLDCLILSMESYGGVVSHDDVHRAASAAGIPFAQVKELYQREQKQLLVTTD